MPVKTSPYVPSFLRAAISGSRQVQMTFSEIADTNIASTSSFAYDPSNAPLRSTQQLNVDWSSFENHTFFSSAEVNVNAAFDQIINGYPFDGTRTEVEAFFEKLTGWEKWVYDQFPKYRGALLFSGTLPAEVDGNPVYPNGSDGTWINVIDRAGSLYPEISRANSGDSILNPRDGISLSIEMQLRIAEPDFLTNCAVVCEKASSTTMGYSIFVDTRDPADAKLCFSYCSGSAGLVVSASIPMNEYVHVCAVLNRDTGHTFSQLYFDETLVAESDNSYEFDNLFIDQSPFTIGHGSGSTFVDADLVADRTFSGSIDELRVFHSVRTVEQQKMFAKKAIYATPDLKLYYRFNEPEPQLGGSSVDDEINSIVLDSSGNSLHAVISNFTGSLRVSFDEDDDNPMTYEKDSMSPILFSAHEDVVDLNILLLSSASRYDAENPNLITKMIPQHYLNEGANFDGMSIDGTIISPYTGSGIPGQGEMGSAQMIMKFLFIWAKHFDELKLYTDAFKNLRYVDYDTNDTVPDNFLKNLVSQYGFYLPPLFNNSTIDQFVNGENIGQAVSTETYSLQYVQQQLLRRVLVNMPEMIRSKGTHHSIKSFLRATGIDPENSVRIREYGGPVTKQMAVSRETKRETNYMVAFSTGSLVVSPFLTAPRVEVGFPEPSGTMTNQATYNPHGRSNSANDELLTSGSWSVEAIVKFPTNIASSLTSITQSLFRMLVTGSSTASTPGLLYNLVAISGSIPRLELYGRNNADAMAKTLHIMMPLTASDGIFSGDTWNVSFGRQRNDEIASISSSYFVRCARSEEGNIVTYAATSSFFDDSPAPSLNVLQNKSTLYNASGTYLAVGTNQTLTLTSSGGFLRSNSDAMGTTFQGWMSNLRFWSMALTSEDWKEHVRNYKSSGVSNPLTSWNYVRSPSGSWGRMRLDTFTKQAERQANSTASLSWPTGSMLFYDFSENRFHMTGTGFPIEEDVLRGNLFNYSYLSPYFDDAATTEKIRIRSYEDPFLLKETPWANVAPVNEIVKSEQPTDDVRYSIDFSLIDALNRDIVLMFSTFDSMDNAIGDPTLAYSPDYPDLERMRDVYFERIKARLNFKAFFEFYRWFDRSIGTFIEQLIPRKTRFGGTNFTIESHMLERHKLEYFTQGQYLTDADRPARNVLLVQLISGELRKY